jgi:hypothetical protein
MTLENKIALIASLVALLQFIALVITIRVMINSPRRQLRAYVFPDNVGLMDGTMLNPPQPVHTNEPGVVLIIKNSGQTPAYNVISCAMINVIEPINEERLVVPKLSASISINNIGPGGVISKALWFGRALTTNEIQDVASRARAIYLYGRIEYTDAFEKKRYTNFRLNYAGIFPYATGMIFTFTGKGNEAN